MSSILRSSIQGCNCKENRLTLPVIECWHVVPIDHFIVDSDGPPTVHLWPHLDNRCQEANEGSPVKVRKLNWVSLVGNKS